MPHLPSAVPLCSALALSLGLPAQTSQPLPEAPSPTPSAALRGHLLGPNGTSLAGASVVLLRPNTPVLHATTLPDGTFTLTNLPPGTYTLTVALADFDRFSTTVTLAPAQTLDLPPVTLQLTPVTTTVTAVDPHQLAEQQLHIEEQQRLIGVFPNFYVSYNWYAAPLSTGQKFRLAFHNAADPGNLFGAAISAGIQQATNSFPGYGQGAAGYGRRYGASLGNIVGGTYLGGAILPSLFHQDPRYFYKGTGSIRSRVVYAASRAVIFRGDNGRWQPGYASVLGDFASGALSNAYYAPSDRQGVRLTLINGLVGVAGDAANNIIQEFVYKKLTPRSRRQPPTAPAPD